MLCLAQTNGQKNTYLRPDDGLEDGVELVQSEAVRVEAVEEVLDPEDAEAPQVLQRADAPWTQLKTVGSQSEHSSFTFIWLLAF